MNTAMRYAAVALLSAAAAWAVPPAAPTFQELMDPEMFPHPQRGLKVESAAEDGEKVRIRTTGAEILIDSPRGAILFMQRISHARPLAMMRFGVALQGVKVTHSGSGFAMVTCEQPKLTIRVNGDSLFMLQMHEAFEVALDRKFVPRWNASFKTNHLIADEWGAFGLYCSDTTLNDKYDAYAKTVAQYPLPADAVLWVAVCPPKPYEWLRSLHDNVIWHWSKESAYPSDDTLREWKGKGNIVLLQSEMMLWKDWNLDFVPRDEAEFARVRKTLRKQNMRMMVYTSPAYFLKGTALESKAINTFEGFKDWPPATVTGENMEIFLDAIKRMVKQYKPDGLYFDGQYTQNPAALYALARRAREIVGEMGLLEWHSTLALGDGLCYLPQADAYVDIILRGEGQTNLYSNADYLRYFVSGYNINNCVGVVCDNAPPGLTPQLARDGLAVNARFHLLAGAAADESAMQVWRDDYLAKLEMSMRQDVDRQMDARQESAPAKAAAASLDEQTLKAPPQWGAPSLVLDFDTMPIAQPVFSPTNPDAFETTDGLLRIHAHAHTYAFLRVPMQSESSGFVILLRQTTDVGMSWGPGAMMRWTDGGAVRVGIRSDGMVQADVLGKQYVGGVYAANQWAYLRARWTGTQGVIERSSDGTNYDRLWTFEHGGALNRPPMELLVGKVPFSGQAQDYGEPGPVGMCDIDFVQVYGK
ncbi:MAG: hypothetical protein HZB26_05840 [Candidatus Hydrogenedentes bacterium]|nr:hypothetical protein [Candidatus Hydrogenedentota bacterium]